MTALNRQVIEAALQQYVDPYLNQDLVSAGMVTDIRIDGSSVDLMITLGYPCAGVKDLLVAALTPLVQGVDGVTSVVVNVAQRIAAHPSSAGQQALSGVKNVIAVASGKGGVGKSTTTVNLALAMAAEGAKVGILDADIYGPSQGLMLGVPAGQRPQPYDEKHFSPIEALGLQTMSMAYLIDEDQPMVWRGPMAGGALQQLLTQTHWDELDYLFIDMPPGTGDVHLTLSQKAAIAGSVIVTTPQDIALLDAKKGIEMFRKVDIPILGVVENMSLHTCSNCGHTEHVFGAGGGERIAADYQTRLLGALPLSLEIRQQADSGKPTVVAEPASDITAIYKDIARSVAAELALANKQGDAIPTFSVQND